MLKSTCSDEHASYELFLTLNTGRLNTRPGAGGSDFVSVKAGFCSTEVITFTLFLKISRSSLSISIDRLMEPFRLVSKEIWYKQSKYIHLYEVGGEHITFIWIRQDTKQLWLWPLKITLVCNKDKIINHKLSTDLIYTFWKNYQFRHW